MPVELDGRVASALQVQMGRELVAALTYKQFSYDFELMGWLGFAKFFSKEEQEELGHSCDFGKFLLDRNIRPTISTVQLPPLLLLTQPYEVFHAALGLEKLFWQYIEDLYNLAEDADDPDACIFLRKYIQVQHDSVAEYTTLCTKLARATGDIAALQSLDKHMLE